MPIGRKARRQDNLGTLSRRGLLAAAALLPALPARAAWPTRPIRIVAPTAAGSGSDSFIRIVVEPLSQKLGQSIVVENRSGASGIIGADVVAKAEPDGYSLGSIVGSHVMNRQFVSKMPFDAIADFTPITRMCRTTHVLITSPKAPFATVAEMIAYARKHPGEVTIGGSEALSLYGGNLFARLTGVEITSVPYRGGAAMSTDVIAGNIMAAFTTSVSALPHAREGRLRLLGASSRQRSAQMPDIPTLAEAGVPGFEYGGWYGLVGPAGLPEALTQRIADAVRESIMIPDVRARLEALGTDVEVLGPAEFAAMLVSEDAMWARARQEGLLTAVGGG